MVSSNPYWKGFAKYAKYEGRSFFLKFKKTNNNTIFGTITVILAIQNLIPGKAFILKNGHDWLIGCSLLISLIILRFLRCIEYIMFIKSSFWIWK